MRGKLEELEFDLRLRPSIIGKVVVSSGDVRVYRENGVMNVKGPQFLFEGDLIETQETGACWLTLIDGTLLRLSSHSSISLSEYIFSNNEFQFFIRLNEGEVYGKFRSKEDFEMPKTISKDLVFYPVLSPLELYSAYSYENVINIKKVALNEKVHQGVLNSYLNKIVPNF